VGVGEFTCLCVCMYVCMTVLIVCLYVFSFCRAFLPVCNCTKETLEGGGIHRADSLEDGERAIVTQQITRHIECRDALLGLQNLFLAHKKTTRRHIHFLATCHEQGGNKEMVLNSGWRSRRCQR
jgi:hypothetical protein